MYFYLLMNKDFIIIIIIIMIRYNHVLLDDKLKWTSGAKNLWGSNSVKKGFCSYMHVYLFSSNWIQY